MLDGESFALGSFVSTPGAAATQFGSIQWIAGRQSKFPPKPPPKARER